MRRSGSSTFLAPLIVAALGCIFLSVSVEAQDFCFDPAVNYSVGQWPWSVFADDLDGDEDLDLAVANEGSASISVLKNNGDGTYASAGTYAVGANPISISGADLDGDGDCDLVVAKWTFDNKVAVLRNNGDGTFAAAVDYTVGPYPHGVVAADLDGDGDQDLAVADFAWGSNVDVSVLMNTGNGTFAPAVHHAAEDGSWCILATDLDGDGDPDLAVTNSGSGSISVLKNRGSGTFSAAVNYAVGGGPRSICAADFDRNGDQDLAVTNWEDGTVSVLKNSGTGVFSAAGDYAVDTWPNSVCAADLDGDGNQDLAVVSSRASGTAVFKNNGDGTFAVAVDYATGTSPVSVHAADLDGDGDQDLAVANEWGGDVSVLLNCTPPHRIAVDLLPRQCPNILQPNPPSLEVQPASAIPPRPVLAVAILGDASVDVAEIDPESIRLEGVIPVSKKAEDVATPAVQESGECDCTAAGADGQPDLLLQFDREAILAALGSWVDGDIRKVTLTARLYDGSPLAGVDCLILRSSPIRWSPMASTKGETRLRSNSPNPFNAATTISYSLEADGPARLEIFNVLGQRVTTLVDGVQSAGTHVVTWAGTDERGRPVASGIYLYRLIVGDLSESKTMVLLR